MPENSEILTADLREKLTELKDADILVGIPSYNNARTIGHVVRAVEAGLSKYFSDYKALLVNSDGGSTDGTMDVVKQASVDHESILVDQKTEHFHKIAIPYMGIPGKGSAFRTIFEIASGLNVRACAVVDSDLRSITPEWIELLIKPILEEGYDYVAPYYHRHKYDGTITNKGPLREKNPTAHWGRFWFFRKTCCLLSHEGRVGVGRGPLWDRHLDDHNSRCQWIQGMPSLSRSEDP
jgi:glycosyltransferase involved in cell wall biosynthesis